MSFPPLPPSDLDHILAHTQGLWEELRGQRLFVTGGTGFFGCWLLESFAYANDQLGLQASAVVLTRNPGAFAAKVPHLATHPAVHLHQGDVRSFQFPTGEFSHVIHAAIEYNAPWELFVSTIEGTKRTLEFALHAGARRYLLTSSGAVYGRQPPELSHVPEDYPGAPDIRQLHAAYGEAKRASEFLCSAFREKHGLPTVIARGFAFLGPYLPLNQASAIGNFIADALQARPVLVKGDGTPWRSYLYGSDLAIWLWTILLRGQPGRPYNVGSELAYTIAQVAQKVVAELNPGGAIAILTPTTAGGLVERYVPSTKRAQVELGLASWVNLQEGVRRTASWNAGRLQ